MAGCKTQKVRSTGAKKIVIIKQGSMIIINKKRAREPRSALPHAAWHARWLDL